MKKMVVFIVLIFVVTLAYSQTLDSAIEEAAKDISQKLPAKTTVAVINFQSTSSRLTNYVIDELNGKIANIGKIIPVERRRLDTIRAELNFNMSGEVSDASAQRIGHMIGSQYIMTGAIENIGSQYRVLFQAVTVETASIVFSFSQSIRMDSTLEALFEGSNILVDFTAGERFRASALNLLFGIGSFQQKDKTGGIITAILEGIGGASIAVGIMNSATIGPEIGAYSLYTGLAIYLGGAAYGIIRAQTFHKPGTHVTLLPNDGLQLGLVSLENKNTGFQISYHLRY
jgi:TolB-like protein